MIIPPDISLLQDSPRLGSFHINGAKNQVSWKWRIKIQQHTNRVKTKL